MKQLFLLFLCIALQTAPLSAQKNKPAAAPKPAPAASVAPELTVNETLLSSMQWRNVGPFRGGRSAAVTGVSGKPNLFYFGATGGGVWRTTDGGRSWENLSDGFFGGSIGAIEVAPSDHNVIYVGGGECTVRGNVSAGTGMWKSEDAGRSWKNVGLMQSRHIPRIRIHPTNADIVYAAVLGDLFKPSEERGLYRSRDGGKTWQKIHYINAHVGAVDVCFDPTNPRILYASFWKVRRTPYDLSSGGEGSGLWKSTDGGDTWTELTRNEGLPKDTIGIIGVSVSPVQPDRVFAIIESQSGGVFRSDDGGKKWTKVNEDRNLRQRAWYYTRIYADSKDADVVYVMNVAYHKSKDGGKTFQSKYAPHGDHHDFWVAPEDPNRMIIGDDGGAQISYDGGETWSTYHNQPTAQFYRVTTDNAFPFRIYGAQQDNTSVRIAHRSDGGSIGERDWEPTAGGESGHIAIDPQNNDIVYGGEYHGFMSRVDHKNRTTRPINVWPEDNMGHGAEDAKYRFQWNYPLFFSPHDPKKIYAASNHLHVSTNEGQSWTTISPDLTTNDKSRQKSSGGPITQDNTSVEYYCTIFAAAESKRQAGVIWTGSDDGLVQLTRDGGKTWRNVTPPDLPKWTMINSLEPDPHSDGGCYLACTGYKQGDYAPYLYKTRDYGSTWTKITDGIEAEHFTRVVRADPARQGILYAGTEQGMYVSFTDGRRWQKFQQNLPVVPITDLTIKDHHLIAATQGRSFWIIDDLTPLHQIAAAPDFLTKGDLSKKDLHLFQPGAAYRMRGASFKGSKTAGENHPNGTVVHFYLKNKPGEKDTVTLAVLEADGDTIKLFSNQKLPAAWENRGGKLPDLKAGANSFTWNHRYPDAEKFEGMILWSYDLEGPKAVPGGYRVQVSAAGKTEAQPFEILPDPRTGATPEIFRRQFDFVQSVGGKLSEAHQAIKEIRKLRSQIKNMTEGLPREEKFKPLRTLAGNMDSVMTSVEEAIYQTKNRSSQDPLNFPVRLNDKLANLMGQAVDGDFPPTDQAMEVRTLLFRLTDEQLAKWKNVKEKQLPELNRLVRESGVDLIRL
ncbi:MAG: glycosyl hydrolase [Saprospiraceae bacterium]|nr:glycosyl hydrolase [Saprospiraceae bacterium]